LHSAYNSGAWSGAGLTSDVAVAHPTAFAIGYSDNTTSDQLNYDLTVPGDATLDFSTNFNDLLVVAQHFGQTVAKGNVVSWSTGDVNYDGTVNFNDLLIIAQHFGDTLAAAEAGLTLPSIQKAVAAASVTPAITPPSSVKTSIAAAPAPAVNTVASIDHPRGRPARSKIAIPAWQINTGVATRIVNDNVASVWSGISPSENDPLFSTALVRD